MNKQRYLAELQRLLVFMTEEDRELTIRRYGEIFDAAGPEGQDGVAASLGTPTQAAIRLSRGYTPGAAEASLPAFPASAAPEPVPEPAEKREKEKESWNKLPDYEVPEASASRQDSIKTAAPARARTAPAKAGPELTGEYTDDDDWPDLPRRSPRGTYEPQVVYERSVPLGLGVILFVLIFLALGIPLFLLCAGLTVLFLAPGGLLIFGAYLVLVGGLWSLSVVADAILLFGAALVVLALGLMLLWLGFVVVFHIWKLWGRALTWTAGELLGRKVVLDE